MAIQVQCPECGSTVSAPEESAGKTARCGNCLELFLIPILTAPPSEPLLTESSEELLDPETAPPSRRPRAEPIAPDRRSRPRAIPVPKPPPSRRWVAFLVCGLFLVLLLVGGGIGFAVWKLNRAEWQTHEPPGGGFRVDLPAAPRDLAKLTGAKTDPSVRMFGTVRGLRNEEYGVVWVDIDPWKRSTYTDEKILEESVRELLKDDPGIRTISDRTLQHNGFAAREVVLNSSKLGGTVLFRVVVAESRWYMVVVGGGSADPGSENAQRFLDSFEIIDPQLFAAQEKRLHPERETERQRIAWAKAEAGRIESKRIADAEAAEAKRKAEIEAAEQERLGLQRFLDNRYDGNEPPDPATLPGAALLITFEGDGPTVEARTATDTTSCPLPAKAYRGPGVRGDAIYLTNSSFGIDLKPVAKSAAYGSESGQTLSVWLKARRNTVYIVNARTLGREEYSIRSSSTWLGAFILPDWVPNAFRLLPRFSRDEGWHHYALVRQPLDTGGERQLLYIDGTLQGENTTKARTFTQAPGEFRIGSVENPGNHLTETALDELAIYDRPFDAVTIQYLAGRGPKPASVPVVVPKPMAPVEPVVVPMPKPNVPVAPVVTPKVAVAPRPRLKPTFSADRIVPATEIEGLKLYLSFEKVDQKGVTDDVSGRVSPKQDVPITGVEGMHGTAGRFASDKDSHVGFKLKAVAPDLVIPKDAPFTFAVWMRLPTQKTSGCTLLTHSVEEKDGIRRFSLTSTKSNVTFRTDKISSSGTSIREHIFLQTVFDRDDAGQKWRHITLVRDEKKILHLWLDGREVKTSTDPFPLAVPFNDFIVGRPGVGGFVADFDEFCVFDRALTEDEIKKLAGQK